MRNDGEIYQIEARADQEGQGVGAGDVEQISAHPTAEPHGDSAEQEDDPGTSADFRNRKII